MTSNINNERPTSTEYNRQKEADEFDNSKLGVKGLMDSGITRIPRLFHHPPESVFSYQDAVLNSNDDIPSQLIIPTIDMSSLTHDELVDQIRDAATKFGFFQVINHGVPVSLLDRLLDAVRAVHEAPDEEKKRYYGRDIVNKVTGFAFYSNLDLYQAKAASWRDTISVRLSPTPVNPHEVPDVCRTEVMEWGKEVKQLGDKLVGILSKGLGLNVDRLKGVSYLGRSVMVGNYYPYCPEPNKTVGIASHTDISMLTILLQDQVGGLQVKYDDKWINLKPVDGALVVNIGDFFQILSNDKYKSGEHRVYANPWQKPRVSVGTFFAPGTEDEMYGPLDELISPENPVLYKELKYSDLLEKFLIRELDTKSMANHFRL